MPAAVDTAARSAEEQARQPARKEQSTGRHRPNHGPHPPAIPKGCLTKFPNLIAAAVDCWRGAAPDGRPQSGGLALTGTRSPPHLRGSFSHLPTKEVSAQHADASSGAGDRSADCFNGLGFSERDTALAASAGNSGAGLPPLSRGQLPAWEKATLHRILDDLKVTLCSPG